MREPLDTGVERSSPIGKPAEMQQPWEELQQEPLQLLSVSCFSLEESFCSFSD